MDIPPSDHEHHHTHNQSYYPDSSENYRDADDTLLNTIANSNHHHQPPPQHQDHLRPDGSDSSSLRHQRQGLAQQRGRFTEEWDASQRGSSIIDGHTNNISHHNAMQRSASVASYRSGDDQHITSTDVPGRRNTLKKKGSMRRSGSVGRSNSRRSMRAGSVRSLALNSATDPDEANSAFFCPVPTSGNPTEVLSARFQGWRKVLKDLITYFREIQTHYEAKSKSLLKLANVSNNISTPSGFLQSAGVDDALQFLRAYNKVAILEANKAKDIEEDVILALTGLRSDLQQKIKEIKNLSGDFKNSVQKEMDHTAKAVQTLADVLGKNEVDSATTTGKQDPFLLRLAVDRQVERQIDEENYLHQAYLNLESSGRELEGIVVGEIQKAYNAYAGILKREADNAYSVIEELRDGPISMPKDQEWIHFVTHDNQFLDPTIPLRAAQYIHYPGRDHVAAQEIRAGLLERKSKYLKSYTAGWYVLSTTHLHEFKSADKGQAPVMSLYLPEQKLGSHSAEGGSSNKFILKGRQTGSMHRGHTWVFRAESHDTMMAWYEDIKTLTETTPEQRSQFVRNHSRSLSQSSRRSTSSDGIVDEDDDEPFSAGSQIDINSKQDGTPRRSQQPGGRFPSDIQVNSQRGLQAPHSPSSISSGIQDQQQDITSTLVAGGAAAGAAAYGVDQYGQQRDLERQDQQQQGYGTTDEVHMDNMPSQAAYAHQEAWNDGVNPYTSEPLDLNQGVSQTQQYEQHPYHNPEQNAPAHHTQQAVDNSSNNNNYFVAPLVHQQKPRDISADEAYGTQPQGGMVSETDATTQQPREPIDEQQWMNGNTAQTKGNSVDANPLGIHGTLAGSRANTVATDATADLLAPTPPTEATVSASEDRPVFNTVRTDTISNLHTPGGFPHSAKP